MLSFPNCKINLGLHILRKRTDGFHDLETVFYPVGLRDALEVVSSEQSAVGGQQLAGGEFNFSQTGLEVDGDQEDNLCYKAYHILKRDFPQLPAVKMHLHKSIPMGAGLGGGSADAAFALKLLNDKFRLNISQDQLLLYAATLGSDGPFFIINKPCFATSRGEKLEEIKIDLSNYNIMLVNPGIHINTGWAFSQLFLDKPTRKNIKEILQQPVEDWKEWLTNDFEEPVFKQYPLIAAAKKELYEKGALYAAMSGSGSTVFGIFKKEQQPVFNFDTAYFLKVVPA